MISRSFGSASRRLLVVGFTVVALCAASIVVAVGQAEFASAQPQSQSQHDSSVDRKPFADGGFYPRALRLEHNGDANGRIIAGLNAFEGDSGYGAIYESTDSGAGFSQVGKVAPPEAAGGRGMCCATLYELPQKVGDMPAGTLLWAVAIGSEVPEADRRMSIQIWSSADVGRSWNHLSDCATAKNSAALWEPELSVSEDGALNCYYADETDPDHSQNMTQASSVDGIKWTDRKSTISTDEKSDRPGMPNVRRLADGSYFMAYEICQHGKYFCAAYYRTSSDGRDWGDATKSGTVVESTKGKFFAHAPTISLGPDGKTVYLVGQILQDSDGKVAAENGDAVFTNKDKGAGGWSMISAPVKVKDPYDDSCPNYSSALLPSEDHSALLEIATDYDGKHCKPYYATDKL